MDLAASASPRRLGGTRPGRGRAHFLRIVDALLDVQPEASELAVDTLLHALARLAPKRSLLATANRRFGEDFALLAGLAALFFLLVVPIAAFVALSRTRSKIATS